MVFMSLYYLYHCRRWFWISWENGFLQVGHGLTVNMYPYVSIMAPEPAYPVQAVALASAVEATWEFAEVPSKLTEVEAI